MERNSFLPFGGGRPPPCCSTQRGLRLNAAITQLQPIAGGAPDGVVWTSMIADNSWESMAAEETVCSLDADDLNQKITSLEQDLYL